jgi:chemotaxis protein methyltransferase CheR
LLRNVMIYFDLAMKRAILSKMAAPFNPRGYLLLGAAETAAGLIEELEIVTIGRTCLSRKKHEHRVAAEPRSADQRGV